MLKDEAPLHGVSRFMRKVTANTFLVPAVWGFLWIVLLLRMEASSL